MTSATSRCSAPIDRSTVEQVLRVWESGSALACLSRSRAILSSDSLQSSTRVRMSGVSGSSGQTWSRWEDRHSVCAARECSREAAEVGENIVIPAKMPILFCRT